MHKYNTDIIYMLLGAENCSPKLHILNSRPPSTSKCEYIWR